MSTAATTPDALSRGGQPNKPRPDVLYWTTAIAWGGILTWLAYRHRHALYSDAGILSAWVLATAVIHLLPVMTRTSPKLIADLPISIAGAIVLSPVQAGLVASLGALDLSEFKKETGIAKTLFNKSQIGIASFLASAAVHGVAPRPGASLYLLPLAFLALAVLALVSGGLVSLAVSIGRGHPLWKVARQLRIGTFSDFGLTLLAWGLLGAMLAALYQQVHVWALFAFLAPTLLTRQALSRSQKLLDTSQAYAERERAVIRLVEQIREERSDERRLIAADLHDEILQPIFKVSLMAQVLKADLVGGRLLEMDEDLPALVDAAELASKKIRDLIGDLRASAIGAGGLSEALRKMVQAMSAQTPIVLHSEIAEVQLSAASQLAMYQIAKEAIGNAIVHSSAKNVWVRLTAGPSDVLLQIGDDGRGFDPVEDSPHHYGIPIMRERAAAAGGHLFLDSAPGKGCEVTVVMAS